MSSGAATIADPAPSGAKPADILAIENLDIVYRSADRRVRATTGMSLRVAEGESVGIVGESGSGKSTIARAVLGLLPEGTSAIENGRIVVAGRDVTGYSQSQWESMRGNPVAMVFQDPLSFLNPIRRIGRQIGESVRRHDPDCDQKARVRELLAMVSLPEATARAYPHQLSGGMRQRALLAIALGCRPLLLVADEPTTALDSTTQAEILALLRDLRAKLGMAMLFISHDLGVISGSCDRLYVMYAGQAVEWGATGAVFAQPTHPYTNGLLHAAAAHQDERGRFLTIPGDVFDLSRTPRGCPFRPRCANAIAPCAEEMPGPSAVAGLEHEVRCWAPIESSVT